MAGHAVETCDLETSDILSLYSGARRSSGTVENSVRRGAGAALGALVAALHAVKTITAYAKDTSKFLIRDRLT